jgi:hypothetical protein
VYGTVTITIPVNVLASVIRTVIRRLRRKAIPHYFNLKLKRKRTETTNKPCCESGMLPRIPDPVFLHPGCGFFITGFGFFHPETKVKQAPDAGSATLEIP